MNWEGGDRRKALAEGSVLMGMSPACEQVCLQVAKPGRGGCPPQGAPPGDGSGEPPEALSGWALELRAVSRWTRGPGGAGPP